MENMNLKLNKVMIKKFRGISASDLIKILSGVEPETKICIEILGDNFPAKVIGECIYYDWENGKKVQENKGILIR